MVIVLVANNFHADGDISDFSVKDFAEKLSNRGHKIRIITYDDELTGQKNRENSYEIFHVLKLKLPLASLFCRREYKLSAMNINKALSGANVVHICQPSILGKKVYKAAKRSAIPAVAGFYNEPENIIRWLFYRNFSHIHCLSKSVAAQLRAHGYKAWLHVISNEQDSPENSVRRMEIMYSSLSGKRDKNEYAKGLLFKLFSRLFYTCFAIPLMKFWMHVVLGARIRGKENLKGLRSAVTVCNHVHFLDSVMVALALFPRKATFPTFTKNIKSLWPGKIVRILGGVPIPENISEVKTFFNEMEFLLRKNHIVHLFPEGIVRPYDTCLRSFKKGAFYLAAQARVPIVPMIITFEPPKRVYRLIRKKPVMTLHVGKPIEPVDTEPREDAQHRMKVIYKRMNSFAKRNIEQMP
ncbi:MAG TPA: glycosyltransferase [Clostridiaceae bacterium]|nr:glycosyltransferase [Clostridiaceae bacterium]